MIIPIKIGENVKVYFEVVLRIMNPVLKLRDREIEVMALILSIRYINMVKGMNIEELDVGLFSIQMRKLMREDLGMSEQSYNNHIKELRKKGLLTGKSVSPIILEVNPDDKGVGEVTFKVEFSSNGVGNHQAEGS